MSTARPPTHEHLLTLANKVKAAAEDGDLERLRPDARRLYEGLERHLDAEAAVMLQATPADSRLLRRGQRRLVDTARDLLRQAEMPAHQCRCRGVAEMLAAELTLQAEDERRCLSAAGGDGHCEVRTPVWA